MTGPEPANKYICPEDVNNFLIITDGTYSFGESTKFSGDER